MAALASFSQTMDEDDEEQYTFNLALEIISRVLPLNTPSNIRDMQGVLSKIVSNILSKPTEQKYRTLKLQNKPLRSKFFDLQGAKEIMFIMGFHKTQLLDEEKSSAMVLPLDVTKGSRTVDEQMEGLSSSWSWLDTQLKVCLEMKNPNTSSSSCCAECLLRIHLPTGFVITGGFFSEEPLSSVVDFVNAKRPIDNQPNEYGVKDRVWVLSQSHPQIVFSGDFLNQSLASLRLSPRATLIAHVTEPNLTQEEIKSRQESKMANALKKAHDDSIAAKKKRDMELKQTKVDKVDTTKKEREQVLKQFTEDRERAKERRLAKHSQAQAQQAAALGGTKLQLQNGASS